MSSDPLWIGSLPWAELATILMAFAWGATLGSFVNVVIHRLPRGESVVAGNSRCPRCGAGIRPRDNIPVLGWLLLRGRCRDCGGRISARYPLVEAACGAIAATVAAAELVGGGRWLLLPAWGGRGIDRLLLHGDWRLVVSWALHTAVLLTIFAAGALGRTGYGRACRVAGWAVIATVAVVFVVPPIGPAGVLPSVGPWPREGGREWALVAAVAGIAAGRIAGAMMPAATDGCRLSILGAALGWQAVTFVAVVTAAVRLVSRWVGWPLSRVDTRELPDCDALLLAATVQVVAWRPLLAAWTWACGRLTGG